MMIGHDYYEIHVSPDKASEVKTFLEEWSARRASRPARARQKTNLKRAVKAARRSK